MLQVCLRTCRCVRSTGMRCGERLAWPPAEESHSQDAEGLCPTLRHERTHVSWPRALLMPCACARLGAGLRACLVTQCYEGAAPAERQAWLWERLGASGRSKLAYQAFLGRAPMPV